MVMVVSYCMRSSLGSCFFVRVLRIHKTRLAPHAAYVGSRRHSGQGRCLCPKEATPGGTGRRTGGTIRPSSPGRGGHIYARSVRWPFREENPFSPQSPDPMLWPGDFPCKWHFDIKMLCLRNRRPRAAFLAELKAISLFFIFGHIYRNIPIFSYNNLIVQQCNSYQCHRNSLGRSESELLSPN